MRSLFPGHYPLSNEEEAHLWDNSSVVFDANALLNLYRYSIEARRDLLAALRHLQDRLWCPHQVAFEFHSNRLSLIHRQNSVGVGISGVLERITSQAAGQLGEYSKNAFLDIEELKESLASHVELMKKKVKEEHAKGIRKYGVKPTNDPILKEVALLYSGKVGNPYSDSELVELRKRADSRYELEIPPGYKDSGKNGLNRQYGDYILWEQVIDHATNTNRPVLIVTDENKEDWWWISSGETIGPRPELRQEFQERTGQICYLYQPARFLERLRMRTQIQISEQVVDEVSDTSLRLADYERRRRRELTNRRRLDHYDGIPNEMSTFRRTTKGSHIREVRTKAEYARAAFVEAESRQHRIQQLIADIDSDITDSRDGLKSDFDIHELLRKKRDLTEDYRRAEEVSAVAAEELEKALTSLSIHERKHGENVEVLRNRETLGSVALVDEEVDGISVEPDSDGFENTRFD